MINNCPHCKKSLQLSGSHKDKIQKALDNLQSGKRLTIKCPHCKQGISLENKQSQEIGGNAATGMGSPPSIGSGLNPPPPPDLEWLKNDDFKEEDNEEDIPLALVLYPGTKNRERVVESLETVGYRVICDENVNEAVERMNYINFACIVLHSDFERKGIDESSFHEYMRNMTMMKRRYIFYILIGPVFHTLYNMEALSSSANLVVNDQDLQYLDVILRQSIPAHETLFGAIMEEVASFT